MKYDNEVLEYLNGKRFNNGKKFGLINYGVYLYRDDYLVNLVKNKKIIHLGFADHIQLIEQKIKSGKWLHKNLMDNSLLCIGIDINREAINYLRGKYNYSNLYAIDVIREELPYEISREKIDFLLVPDVIEHIGNPVSFLKAIKHKFTNVEKIVLTAPNAFRLNNFIFALKNTEFINTDHRFWFTPYTLSKVVIDAGFEIEKMGFYEHGYLSRMQIIRKLLLFKFFALRDTLVIEIKNKL